MTSVEIGFAIGAFTLVLLALRVHIGMAMLLGGSIGYTLVSGWDPLMSYFKHLAYGRFSVYDLSVVPLFLLMGNIASRAGCRAGCSRPPTPSSATTRAGWR